MRLNSCGWSGLAGSPRTVFMVRLSLTNNVFLYILTLHEYLIAETGARAPERRMAPPGPVIVARGAGLCPGLRVPVTSHWPGRGAEAET